MIEVKDATISTLSVSIQTLHVGGKQMTVSVYKQLEEKLWGPNDHLWGRVNYHTKHS